MLSGKTSVYIDTSKSDEEADMQQTTGMMADDEQGSGKDGSSSSTRSGSTTHTDGGQKKPMDRSKHGKFIRHFDAGQSFGEIALMSDDSVRNASVIADEDTDLLLIHRDLFNRSMKAQQEKEYQERKDFINNCRLFSDWTPRFKHLLEMSIRKEEYHYGANIMRQGEPTKGLIFIVSGQARVLMEADRHKQQYPQLMTQASIMEKEFGRHNKENHVQRKSITSLTNWQIRVRRREGYAAAEKRYMTKSLELCTVECSEVLGDMETLLELGTCSCTVTCTANTTAFVLDVKNYDRLVSKKNLNTIYRAKQSLLRKLHSRIATTNGNLVPMLKIVHDKLYEELKPRLREQPKQRKIDEDARSIVLSQMIKLYLKGKGPMIDPLLPDSFSSRLLADKRNRQIEKEDTKKQKVATQMRQRIQRAPRSLKQLQTTAAESELLHPNRSWLETAKPCKDRHLRPKTALGIENSSYSESNASNGLRPTTSAARSSGVFHLTECEGDEDRGAVKSLKDKSVLVTENYGHVFNQLDNIQREKTEARSKVICSVAARNEVRDDVDGHLGFSADDLSDDEYYDYETSNSNLKSLEERIKTFCDDVRLKRHNDPIRIDELKSFHVKDSDSVPLSGGTVYVNRKVCAYPKNSRLASDVHQHVRRFMITRDQNRYSSASISRPKSTSGHKQRPKSAW